jgi:hypothetical protein
MQQALREPTELTEAELDAVAGGRLSVSHSFNDNTLHSFNDIHVPIGNGNVVLAYDSKVNIGNGNKVEIG